MLKSGLNEVSDWLAIVSEDVNGQLVTTSWFSFPSSHQSFSFLVVDEQSSSIKEELMHSWTWVILNLWCFLIILFFEDLFPPWLIVSLLLAEKHIVMCKDVLILKIFEHILKSFVIEVNSDATI